MSEGVIYFSGALKLARWLHVGCEGDFFMAGDPGDVGIPPLGAMSTKPHPLRRITILAAPPTSRRIKYRSDSLCIAVIALL